MSTKTYEPRYMCWVEKDFLADRAVMRMTSATFIGLCSRAPSSPTAGLTCPQTTSSSGKADADDLAHWQANKGPVLSKFQPYTAEDGTALLAHKRILSDWAQVLDYVDKKRKAGVARQQRSARAEQPAAPALKPKVLKETEKETETQTRNGTEPAQGSGAVTESSHIPTGATPFSCADGSGGTVAVLVQEPVASICELWTSLYGSPAEPTDVADIIQQHYAGDAGRVRAELQDLLPWAAYKSNHWNNKKGVLRSTADLLRHFAKVHGQWSLYRAKEQAGEEEKQLQRTMRETVGRQVHNAGRTPFVSLGPEPAGEEEGDLEFGAFDIREEDLDD